MDALFQEMMRTLREAREAVQTEMELHAGADSRDSTLLRRLRGTAEEFAGQASSLAQMMRDRDAERALIREAEELSVFFHDARERIAFILAAGRG